MPAFKLLPLSSVTLHYGLTLFNKSFFSFSKSLPLAARAAARPAPGFKHEALGFTKTIKDLLFSVFSVVHSF
jgi:hypothetical protein